MVKVNIKNALPFVKDDLFTTYHSQAQAHLEALYYQTGKGSDFLGWVNLPSAITKEEIKAVEDAAAFFHVNTKVVVVVGIGGSYLGAKAAISALQDNFADLKQSNFPRVIFAGQNLSEDYMMELLTLLDDYKYGIVVISKSGTTTEPAVAFRLLKAHLEMKIGRKAAKDYIVAITDEKKGALRSLAQKEGYRTFVIPDNIGGRYSVLTPVGLLPIAIAGFNIKDLIHGARQMQSQTNPSNPDNIHENPAATYAAIRNALYQSKYTTEILGSYNPKLMYTAEWWKQLYGESEGKDKLGIFPASVTLTADLHSMGQYIQDGPRNLFESILSIEHPNYYGTIPSATDDSDGLNYLASKRINEVNRMAELGTTLAHVDGGVPNVSLQIEKLDEEHLGALFYFFEIACGISGYMLGVNPFDQPGVEAYKKNMFALLNKPGYEQQHKELQARLK